MPIQTVLRDDGEDRSYTRISNKLLQHPEIADDTLGMICRLLSRPRDWEISIEGLIATSKGGKTKIRRQVEEARKLGFMRREIERDASGKVVRYVYRVSDNPEKLAETNPLSGFQEVGEPLSGFLEAGELEVGNQPQQKKEPNKEKIQQTNMAEASPSAASVDLDKAIERVREAGFWVPDQGMLKMLDEVTAEKEARKQKRQNRKPRTKNEGSPEFEECWFAFKPTRRASKPAAMKAWDKEGCQEVAHLVLAGIKAYTAQNERNRTEDQYIKQLPGWLNERRWESFVPSSVPSVAAKSEVSDSELLVMTAKSCIHRDKDIAIIGKRYGWQNLTDVARAVGSGFTDMWSSAFPGRPMPRLEGAFA